MQVEKTGGEFPVIERRYEVQFPFISNVEKRMVKSESAPEGTEKDAAKKVTTIFTPHYSVNIFVSICFSEIAFILEACLYC